MRIQDIKIGEYYRLRSSPTYGYLKAISIIKPKTGININTFMVIECEHTVYKNDSFGFIKYYKPCDLLKEKVDD